MSDKSGEPDDDVVPSRPEARRTGRGAVRGQIRVPGDFDEFPDDIADAFGVRLGDGPARELRGRVVHCLSGPSLVRRTPDGRMP